MALFPTYLLPLLLIAADRPFPMIAGAAELNGKVREIIAQRIESREAPGIQYVVVTADSTLFSYSGGLADVEAQRPLTPGTTMMIYSMSKTITAAAVLQLVEQGTISLDDPVARYVQGLPYGEGVKIRHLLSQTSGIPNPIPLRWVHPVEEHAAFDEENALREILRKYDKLDFSPGEEYGYSNISYWLLGRVIEKATGKKYEAVVRENIFNRLGVDAHEIDFIIPSPRDHAKGYLPKWSFLNLFKSFLIDAKYVGEYEDGWLHIRDHYLNGPAFGGIVASARAIGVFLQNVLCDSSRLFAKETKALFFSHQKRNNGESAGMTLGWHIGGDDNAPYYFKEGGGGGFHAEMRVYPAGGIASVVIANNTSFDADEFLTAADREFLKP